MIYKLHAIDCGLDGGIATVLNGALTGLERMPTQKFDNGNALDVVAIQEILKDATVIVIEKQFNPNGKPQKGSFTNGSNYGAIVTIARLTGAEVVIVNPTEWKGFFNLLNTPSRSKFLPKISKKDSVIKANDLFNLELRPNLDGVAEALLLLEWYRNKVGFFLGFITEVEKSFVGRERKLRTLSPYRS